MGRPWPLRKQKRPPPPLASHAATHVIAEATLTVPDLIAVARALCRAIPCGADILRWIIHPRDPHCQATLSLLSCIDSVFKSENQLQVRQRTENLDPQNFVRKQQDKKRSVSQSDLVVGMSTRDFFFAWYKYF